MPLYAPFTAASLVVPTIVQVADAARVTSAASETVIYTSIAAARQVTGTTRAGAMVIIVDASGSAGPTNKITFAPSSGLVRGAASLTAVNTPYGVAGYFCDGSNWWELF